MQFLCAFHCIYSIWYCGILDECFGSYKIYTKTHALTALPKSNTIPQSHIFISGISYTHWYPYTFLKKMFIRTHYSIKTIYAVHSCLCGIGINIYFSPLLRVMSHVMTF